MAQNQEISNTAPLWWELQNIPTQVVRELRRRSNSQNIGLSVPSPYIPTSTFNFESNYNSYKGPMTPWVRVFSNSTGKSINGMVPHSSYLDRYYVPVDYDGFILKGGDGFYDAFGYDSKIGFNQTNAIIGYQADGKPHFIDGLYRTQLNYTTRTEGYFPQNNQTPSVLPPPGITQVTVKQSKEFLTYATINFKCYGLAQLEYLTPFFLTAGINVFVEFGWNLFNQKSILNLADEKECWEIIEKPQTALDRANISNGNYGCVSGIVTKYSFVTVDGYTYDCTTELISRQGLFAGMRTDTNAKISMGDSSGDKNDTECLDLRTFFKLYLPSINQVLIENQNDPKSNFLNYIVDKINSIKPDKLQKDADANAQQSENQVKKVIETINNNNNLFYDGKPEDRVFIGRLEEIYKKKNSVSSGPVISYGNIKPSSNINSSTFNQYSDIDIKTDFDGKDGAKEVWMQLDFVFELINLFMSNKNTNQFLIDIKDIIVNAHPNLISCDKNVLIPNPVAPKVNKGTVYKKGSPNSGYIKTKDTYDDLTMSDTRAVSEFLNIIPSQNFNVDPFISQLQDITVERNTELENKYKEAKNKNSLKEFYKTLTVEESYYLACESARKAFKTAGRVRDNLDSVINYLYYNSINKNDVTTAAFPFAKETVGYKRYYYGYLKHIYISKTKLIEIVKSEETKGFKQFLTAILNTLNSATENFWKFEIVDGQNKEGKSTLSIIDKNTSNLDALKQVYTFELGSTNNVVRSIDFNVNLTNEQAINVLFGGQNSAVAGLKDKYITSITKSQTIDEVTATLTDLSKVPFLKFTDRMDRYQLTLLAEKQKEQLKSSPALSNVPGTTSGIENDNSMIESIQKYGPQESNGILCMSFKQVSSVYENDIKVVQNIVGTGRADASIRGPSLKKLDNVPKNYKYLCLPNELRGKLLQMLDDGDYRHNSAKYSGVADNFTVTIKFDGIFSFRNLQVFAINNLPKPYVPGNVIFQVLEVDHTVTSGKWETVVNALVRCIGGTELEYVTI